MKVFCRWFLAGILYYTGLLRLYEYWAQKDIKIILYHRVYEVKDDVLQMGIPPVFFQKQIEYLHKHYRIISLKQALSFLEQERDIKEQYFVVTFDDGYQDNFANAFPVLKRYRVPAAIFLTAALMNTDDLFWYDKLKHIIFNWRCPSAVSVQFPLAGIEFEINAATDRRELFIFLLHKCKQLTQDKIEEFLIVLHEKAGGEDLYREEERPLSWQEVRCMAEEGIEIGSHGLNHTILTKTDKYEKEVRQSKAILEDVLSASVIAFSYPNGERGDFNEEIKKTVKKAGYACALTNINGANSPNSDVFELKRKCISFATSASPRGKFSLPLFACETSGIFDRLFWRKHKG